MDVKVRAAVAAGFEGISVSGLAAELGMSRRCEVPPVCRSRGLRGLVGGLLMVGVFPFDGW